MVSVEEPDIVSPLQSRLVAGLGTLVVGAAAFAGWASGETNLAGQIAFVLGVAAMTFILPPAGSPVVTRPLFALLIAATAWFLEPMPRLAHRGLQAKLNKGNALERGLRLQTLYERGRRDFVELDLRNIDCGEQNLEAIRLDGSSLQASSFEGATLRGASFRDADLSAVDFRGADLSGSDIATAKGFVSTLCDADTVFSGNWTCSEEGQPSPGQLFVQPGDTP